MVWCGVQYGILANNPKPDLQTIERGFDGNICRCTGYRPILKAMHSFAPTQVTHAPLSPCAFGSALTALSALPHPSHAAG